MQEVPLGSLAIQGLLRPDISDLYGLGWQDATDGYAWAGLLSSPDMMERCPHQSQSNLGLYVVLVHTLSWSTRPHGGCCFLHLGHISHMQVIIQYQEAGHWP